jgi:FkbM family methyltransferase
MIKEKLKFCWRMFFKVGPFTLAFYILRMVIVAIMIEVNFKKMKAFGHPYIVQSVLGRQMQLDTADKGISIDLYFNKIREPYFAAEFRNNVLKRGQVVIDIGANIGYYALMESSIVGFVHAIEPVSKNMYLLQKNVQINNIKNIKTYRMAVGDFNGIVDIGVSNHGNLCSIKNTLGKYATEAVSIMTLDEFVNTCKVKPDVIRMDVEGYCPEIIEGGLKTLKENNVLICMELHPVILSKTPVSYLMMLDWLEYFGYEIKFASIEPNANIRNTFIYPCVKSLGNLTGLGDGILNIKLSDLRTAKYQCGIINAVELVLGK